MSDPAAARRRSHDAFRLVLFAAPILIVLAQGFYVASGHREPYPALLMPDFSGARTSPDGSVPVTLVEVTATFEDGTSALVPRKALFAQMPRMTTIAASEWSLRCPLPTTSPTAEWLRTRVRDLHAGRPAARIVVNWFADAYRVDTGRLVRRSRTLVDSCVVAAARSQPGEAAAR